MNESEVNEKLKYISRTVSIAAIFAGLSMLMSTWTATKQGILKGEFGLAAIVLTGVILGAYFSVRIAISSARRSEPFEEVKT